MTPNDQVINVLYCIDNSYLPYAGVALSSLLMHNPNSNFFVTVAAFQRDLEKSEAIFSSILSKHYNCDLVYHDLTSALFDKLPVTSTINKSTYTRLIFDRFLRQEASRVLYMDADTLVLEDIRPLWTTDLNGMVMGAIADPFNLDAGKVGLDPAAFYFNSGVLLIDRSVWRERQCENRLMDFLASSHEQLAWLDQDALNVVLQGEVKALPLKWNYQARSAGVPADFLGLDRQAYAKLRAAPSLIHYTTSLKPWNAAYRVHYSSVYFAAVNAAALPAWAHAERIRPRGLSQRLTAIKTSLRWHSPALFRFFRRFLKPEQAKLMYREAAARSSVSSV